MVGPKKIIKDDMLKNCANVGLLNLKKLNTLKDGMIIKR
uniref:Uncharacterized protein n=1 Tax=Rhizophora mucronata TaxID=61149 RepID=A0A2P2J1Z0_RHIMU